MNIKGIFFPYSKKTCTHNLIQLRLYAFLNLNLKAAHFLMNQIHLEQYYGLREGKWKPRISSEKFYDIYLY